MNNSNFSRFAFTVVAAALLASSTGLLYAQNLGYDQQPDVQQNDAQQDSQVDPPSRVGRLSVMQGNVSFQSPDVDDFSPAELNYPLSNGDRLYTDNGALAEVEAGQLAVRLGQQTDFTVTSLTDEYAQFGLAQGSVHLRAYALDPSTTTELDTPNTSITLLQNGDTRVDVDPQGSVTIVTVLSGQVQVNANGLQQTLQGGQSLRISGSNPASSDFISRARPDGFDSFSGQRDAAYEQASSADQNYVNPDTIGSGDLANYGDWDSSADYGAVWYPRGVAGDWAPYSVGRWVSIAPWGWTWVGAEPWGFAPFHYGRWSRFGNRWGWIPGPRIVRPVYSPALVVFVGGAGFSGGTAAWFPLGPREVYRPWYHASPVYVNRVNVTNIYNRNPVEVRSIYNNRGDAYGNRAPGNYVNRSVATVAQRNFGNGRPVRESAVHVDPRQLQGAAVLSRPPVAPRQQAGARPPARAIPSRGTQRPVLDTHRNAPGVQRGGFGGGAPANNAGRPVQPQNPGASLPNRGDGRFNNGRGTPAQPAQAPSAPIERPAPQQAPGGQNDVARPGPRRQAPDATVRTEPTSPQPQPSAPQQQSPSRVDRPVPQYPERNQVPQPRPNVEQPRPQREVQPAPQRQIQPVPQQHPNFEQPRPQREVQPAPQRQVSPPPPQPPPRPAPQREMQRVPRQAPPPPRAQPAPQPHG